jgi:hypothetical protein
MSFRQSQGDYGTSRKEPKTFHRFFGTTFLKGPDRRWWLQFSDLQRKKSEKIGKARK